MPGRPLLSASGTGSPGTCFQGSEGTDRRAWGIKHIDGRGEEEGRGGGGGGDRGGGGGGEGGGNGRTTTRSHPWKPKESHSEVKEESGGLGPQRTAG